MKCVHFLLITLAILASAISIASASDPSPLQDFCIAIDDPKRALYVNGKFCKDPKFVNANDFSTSGLNIPGNTNNQIGSNVTTVFVDRFPGLNTLGVAIARIDYAPYGENPPHTHPRASEILFVAEGTLYVGFVSSNQDGNRLFAKVINKGDAFVFPVGMIHFQVNIGHTPAIAFAGFDSQFPGVITIASALFGSNPSINPGALAKAFQLDQKVVEQLQKKLWVDAA